MNKGIVLIDAGTGNLRSVQKALENVGASVNRTDDPQKVLTAKKVVLPGVGAFADAMNSLEKTDMISVIEKVAGKGTALLGICLGLQWLFEGSAEAPDAHGLGLMPGRCFRIEGDVKVPHVGWNSLGLAGRPSRLFEGIPPGSSAYFTHSYAAPVVADTMAETVHAVPFLSAVERGIVFGAQFHPEKSGRTGLRMLTNFLRVVQGAA